MLRRLAWCALLLTGSAAALAAGADLSGRWQAALSLEAPALDLVVVVAPGGSEARAFSPTSPGLRLTVEDLTLEGRTVRFRLSGLPRAVSFQGELSDDGKRLEGTATREPAAIPSTDIHLLGLEPAGASFRVTSARNATDRAGYDNQPHFLGDEEAFLYTSMRAGQTDIYRHEPESGATVQLTRTPETSEYSPTPLPGGGGFSVVRVEEDGTQRLWSFDADGTSPRLLLEDVKPVGYHAWLDERTVALFVLGEPPTLQIASLDGGAATVVRQHVGRSLHRDPKGRGVVYVHKTEGEPWAILRSDASGARTVTLTRAVDGSEDIALLSDGRFLTGDGSLLKIGRPGGHTWSLVADLARHGIAGVTRVAVHPRGRLVAVVGERTGDPPPAPESAPLTWQRVERTP